MEKANWKYFQKIIITAIDKNERVMETEEISSEPFNSRNDFYNAIIQLKTDFKKKYPFVHSIIESTANDFYSVFINEPHIKLVGSTPGLKIY